MVIWGNFIKSLGHNFTNKRMACPLGHPTIMLCKTCIGTRDLYLERLFFSLNACKFSFQFKVEVSIPFKVTLLSLLSVVLIKLTSVG